ncbi:MAG: mannitol dehydrogenase family protein [Rhizobiaceae bacterium]
MTTRLSARTLPGAGGRLPGFDRSARAGIVHLGVGAFHKAHQAVCNDDALEAEGGDWLIDGVSLRSPDVADRLNPQDGLYTLLIRNPEGSEARIVGSIRRVLVHPREPRAVLAALADPATRIVSLTITEKGYGLDPRTGGLDPAHASVAGDLESPRSPAGAVGLIVEALRQRRDAGLPGFTVLCCDNLPSNGKVARRLVGDFARSVEPGLAGFIESDVSFPSTMVDRITPASTDKTYADAVALTGREDRAAVETEPFTQWIIEDDFVAGRPRWEAGGAVFVDDVGPYEKMKLRMLNGAHSMLAYSGFVAGHAYVRDVMRDAGLVALIERHHREAARSLGAVGAVDLDAYARDLRTRFANPGIAHETYQIAMDGTQKLPQRILEPALSALESDRRLDAYAFAVAAWMRYCLGMTEGGERYALRDPREAEIAGLVEGNRDANAVADALLGLPGLFPQALASSAAWRASIVTRLGAMLTDGMGAAIAREAAPFRG